MKKQHVFPICREIELETVALNMQRCFSGSIEEETFKKWLAFYFFFLVYIVY